MSHVEGELPQPQSTELIDILHELSINEIRKLLLDRFGPQLIEQAILNFIRTKFSIQDGPEITEERFQEEGKDSEILQYSCHGFHFKNTEFCDNERITAIYDYRGIVAIFKTDANGTVLVFTLNRKSPFIPCNYETLLINFIDEEVYVDRKYYMNIFNFTSNVLRQENEGWGHVPFYLQIEEFEDSEEPEDSEDLDS